MIGTVCCISGTLEFSNPGMVGTDRVHNKGVIRILTIFIEDGTGKAAIFGDGGVQHRMDPFIDEVMYNIAGRALGRDGETNLIHLLKTSRGQGGKEGFLPTRPSLRVAAKMFAELKIDFNKLAYVVDVGHGGVR